MTEFLIRIDPGDEISLDLLARLSQRGLVEPRGRGAGTTLVLGGARSGKSSWAEAQLGAYDEVEYVATSTVAADDAEWRQRVALHRARRPASWRTTETLALAAVLMQTDAAPVLVDCASVWLDRILQEAGAWEEAPGWADEMESRVAGFVQAVAETSREVIIVSNEVGSGIVPMHASARRYRDELGRLNARLAEACDEVWLCTAGIARRLK